MLTQNIPVATALNSRKSKGPAAFGDEIVKGEGIAHPGKTKYGTFLPGIRKGKVFMAEERWKRNYEMEKRV